MDISLFAPPVSPDEQVRTDDPRIAGLVNLTVSDPFGTTQTTAEHLCKTVCDFLKGQFAPARCQRLRVRLGAEDIVRQTLDPLGMNTDFAAVGLSVFVCGQNNTRFHLLVLTRQTGVLC